MKAGLQLFFSISTAPTLNFTYLVNVNQRRHGLLDFVNSENMHEFHLEEDVDDAVRRSVAVMSTQKIFREIARWTWDNKIQLIIETETYAEFDQIVTYS